MRNASRLSRVPTGRRRCITTALKQEARESRFTFLTIKLIGFEHDHIVRLEVNNLEGSCADGIEILLGAFLRFGTNATIKLCLLYDRGVVADEWGIGKRFSHTEIDPDGVRVHCVYRDNVIEVVG